MEVILGSSNEPKRLAVSKAFGRVYPGLDVTVTGITVNSGVSTHPVNGSESLAGALNRAANAQTVNPNADFYVGIEGGLLEVDDRVWELGWVAITNSKGQTNTGVSAGIELRGKILNEIRAGKELNDILQERFRVQDAGKATGFYGLTTDDLVTREQAYEQAIIFALAPFNHPEYFE